jgi:methionyl aminopeptidase
MNPTIPIKTAEEIDIIAEGGRHLAAIRDALAAAAKPGITTQELEDMAARMIKEVGGESTFKGFHGYPAVTCLSVNDEVVHGIPGRRVLKERDVIGIDIGMRYKGWCTDTAVTVALGHVDKKVDALLRFTEESLRVGLEAVRPGNKVGDISFAIQEYLKPHGFGIVRDLTGHGIGKGMHEEPSIPNFGRADTGPVLEEGMVLAIEPMVTLGTSAVRQLDDGWTIVTMDGSLAAHFEHTVAVTKDGCRILTQAK